MAHLPPTARKQYDLDSTILELHEDNDGKHTRKVALNWKASRRVQKLDWPSMLPDLIPIENVWQLVKMKLRQKYLTNCQSLIAEIEVFGSELDYYTCTSYE